MRKFIRWLFWEYALTSDERYDILCGEYYRLHQEMAEQEAYVGHTDNCCRPSHIYSKK